MSKTIKVLFVGQLWEGSTCLMRFKAMRDLGLDVTNLDTSSVEYRYPRLMRAIEFRLSWGPAAVRINRWFVRSVMQTKPDIIWVEKGLWATPQTLSACKNTCGSLLVHYNPDDPFGAYKVGWRNFIRAIPFYDVHFVPRDPNLDEYKKAGAKEVFRFRWGFDHHTHRPISVSDSERALYGGPIGFVGQYEGERASSIQFLALQGLPVRIWGPSWEKHRKFKHPLMRIEGRPVWGIEYVRALCSFDINLCFLRKGNRDLSTTRSIEIPACGAFMLAERTAEHLELFHENREAVYFSSDEELYSKAEYYLRKRTERERIALCGRIRCLRSGYSWKDRVWEMVQKCLSLLR